MLVILNRIGWFLLLLFLQILIFNHIHILGYATPLAYVYLILLFPLSSARCVVLIWGFITGFCADICSNTPGLATTALTLIAMWQPSLLKMFSPRDVDNEVWRPSARSMGWRSFSMYLACGIVAYVTLYFLLESFSFFNSMRLIYNIGGSSLLTFLILIAFESVRSGSIRKRVKT